MTETRDIPDHSPLVGSTVAAGFPSPADDHGEGSLDLNERLVKHPAATFFMRVSGDSMTGTGIHHDDLLIVDRSLCPVDGSVVVAVVEGELTIKLLRQRGARRWLSSANPDRGPNASIELREETDCQIWGVVVYTIHRLA